MLRDVAPFAIISSLLTVCNCVRSGARCRCRAPAMLALMVVLKRLSYPCTFAVMADFFGRDETWVRDIFHTTCATILRQWGHLLTVEHWGPLIQAMAPYFAAAIVKVTQAIPYIVAFFDTITVPTCAPKEFWANMMAFNGHKALHGIKVRVSACPRARGHMLFLFLILTMSRPSP